MKILEMDIKFLKISIKNICYVVEDFVPQTYRRRPRRANAAPLLYLGLRRAFEACVRRLLGSVPLLGVLCAWGGNTSCETCMSPLPEIFIARYMCSNLGPLSSLARWSSYLVLDGLSLLSF